MGTRILRHPEKKITLTRNPRHRHWLSVIRSWKRLDGQGSVSPKTLDEIKSIHLTEIDAKIGKQLARHNYNTIKDLLSPETNFNEPRYLTRKQLVRCPGHRLISEKTYLELIEKLPEGSNHTHTHHGSQRSKHHLQGEWRFICKTKKEQETERQQGKDTHSSQPKTQTKGTTNESP